MLKDLSKKIEALLFATQGLSVSKICETLKEKQKKVMISIKELQKEYEARDSAFIITNENDLWKLTVKSDHVTIVKDLIPSEFPKSLMETLAVIAWKNPAKQSNIIKVRGNKAYGHVKFLLDSGFITSKPSGRTNELKLTDKFYEYFNTTPEEFKDSFKG